MTLLVLPRDQLHARRRALVLYDRLSRTLRAALPAGCDVLHIGATAIPDCLTKGDLDLVVRCRAEDFAAADHVLAARFTRNPGSIRTPDFSAFETKTTTPECGVQLTVRGGELDVFHLFADALRRDPDLVGSYNSLKRRFEGRSMDAYRAAKDAFVGAVLGSPREG